MDTNGATRAVDPYATAKGNIRDTVKWLAATFSALAAIVLAGSPLAGVGKLPIPSIAFFVSSVSLLVAFTCICAAVWTSVNLLRSDALFLSDVAAVSVNTLNRSDRDELDALRNDIDSRAMDVLPANCKSLREFTNTLTARRNRVAELAETLRMAQNDNTEATDAKREYVDAKKRLQDLSPAVERVLAYGSYARLYSRVRRAMLRLFLLGIVALVSLMAFGATTQSSAGRDSGRSIVVNNWKSVDE